MRKFVKNLISRTVCLTAAAALALSGLAGCSGGSESDTKQQESEKTSGDGKSSAGGSGSMGRYLEEEVSLPEGTNRIYDMKKTEDGGIWTAVRTETNLSAWKTKDAGGSWEKVYDLPMEVLEKGSVLQIAIAPDGEMFCQTGISAGEDLEYHYWKLDKEGKASEISLALSKTLEEDAMQGMSNSLYEFVYTSSGDLAGLDYAGKVYLFDTGTGEVKQNFDSTEHIYSMSCLGEELLLQTKSDVLTVEIESGKTKETDEKLKEALLNNSFAGSGFGGAGNILFEQGKDGYHFYADSDGIYSWQQGGNVCDQVVNGALTTLSDPSLGLISLAAMDDDSFMLASEDGNGNPKLLHYVYSADTPSVPETELKIYSLRDSNELRQILSKFQKDNPNILATLQLGMTGEDAVTASDALRTLATDILAGKGPDVLILDGMPVDSYIEKGLLSDISGVVEKAKEKDGMFEQIAGAFAGDGTYYAVPTRFAIPVIQGYTESVDKISDFKSLIETAAAVKEKYPDAASVMGTMDARSMAARLMGVCSPAWQKEDGTLDEALLQEFFEGLSQMYALDKDYREINSGNIYGSNMQGTASDTANSLESLVLLTKSALLNPGMLYGLHDYSYLTSVDTSAGNTSENKMNGQAADVFIPLSVAGVSSKSTHREEAVGLLEYMLGTEGQSVSQGEGFPVNRAAFDKILAEEPPEGKSEGITISSDDGMDLNLSIELPSEEKRQALKTWAESLKIPAVTDTVVKEAVLEQAQRCLEEGISPKDAAKNVVQKVNLYLSE